MGLMKKLSLYIFLVLMWCNVGFAECIKGDCINGYGTYTWESGEFAGDKYVGKWRDGNRHGQGTYTWANGNKYVGKWRDDKINGQGTFTYANGDKYVGGWKDYEQHGQGTYTWANGSKYVGEHKDGEEHGQGTYTWANGNKYVGEVKDGNLHGQGTKIFADGSKYVGEWKDGLPHGQGTHRYADGKTKSGIWENGNLVKRKKLTSEDKKIAKAKNFCRKIGLTLDTNQFLDCTLKMLTTTGGKQTVTVGNRRTSIYPLHCRQMGGASNC